uniref:Uncharacterized protein n=1 Tax=Oryza glumipatula TaxID=40148 RepID=A0A0D9Y5N0_9ORYZ
MATSGDHLHLRRPDQASCKSCSSLSSSARGRQELSAGGSGGHELATARSTCTEMSKHELGLSSSSGLPDPSSHNTLPAAGPAAPTAANMPSWVARAARYRRRQDGEDEGRSGGAARAETRAAGWRESEEQRGDAVGGAAARALTRSGGDGRAASVRGAAGRRGGAVGGAAGRRLSAARSTASPPLLRCSPPLDPPPLRLYSGALHLQIHHLSASTLACKFGIRSQGQAKCYTQLIKLNMDRHSIPQQMNTIQRHKPLKA